MALSGAAAVRLYDDHGAAVHALIARRVGPVLSPDLTAEAFDFAIRNWARFNSTRGSERLFLFGAASTIIRRYPAAELAHLHGLRRPITANEPIDDPLVTRVRTRRARVVDHQANDGIYRDFDHGSSRSLDRDAGLGDRLDGSRARPADGPAGSAPDDLARAMRAVAELSPEDRDILLLTLWEGCSQSEVAEVLALPIPLVRASLGRIRRDLRSATSDRHNGQPT